MVCRTQKAIYVLNLTITMALLSKSKYILGLQCPKLLWVAINAKQRMPKPDSATQQKFDIGTEVGELATKSFEEGVLVPQEGFIETIKATIPLLTKRIPLFEPAFMINNLYSRADVLVPVENGMWDIVEVKSSTKVKDVNVEDVAFQKHVYELSGLKIRNCYLMHMNNQYVRQGELDVKQLFTQTDITKEVNTAIIGIQERIDEMFTLLEGSEPNIDIGPGCTKPYDCDLMDSCWSEVPERSVFNLYYGGKKGWSLYSEGVQNLKDIPAGTKLTPKQQIQFDSERSGLPHKDETAIKAFINCIKFPVSWLDFETINPAVPLFDNSKPYQQICFQYSLHVSKASFEEEPEHYEFLAKGSEDPRIEFAEQLKKELGDSGSIIVYNQAFEIARLKELAKDFPEYSDWVDSVLPRIVDLLIPFRDFIYYHPDQNGSCSIKAVLPAVLGENPYASLSINKGDDASRQYFELYFGSGSSETEEKLIRNALLKYCGLDTVAMLLVVRKLII